MHRSVQALTILVSLVLADVCLAAPPCTKGPSIPRKEFRQLTTAEWKAFAQAVTALKAEVRPTPSGSISTYDTLVKIHIDNANGTHGFASSLPWHRRYLREFEKHLQRVSGNNSITIPYWNTQLDSQAPDTSPIFTTAYMGGNGLVTTGAFAGWRPLFPSVHPLTRRFDSGTRISSWESVELLRATIATTTTYSAFRTQIEVGAHASVHVGIGGDMETMHAPNDPIFWLAEANIDRLWDQWQTINNRANSLKYDGRDNDGSQATLTDFLRPWSSTVRDILWTENLDYCYQ